MPGLSMLHGVGRESWMRRRSTRQTFPRSGASPSMPSLLHDIPVWVRSAGVQQVPLRQAVHCVLETIARTPRLRALLCMKGGILMALHYDSPRFTTDIDFSTPDSFTEEAEKENGGADVCRASGRRRNAWL
ncbi:nucleotidyl transferase AbiEii/AbiGii toxin family protein [Stenotrophomonas rhizophila]